MDMKISNLQPRIIIAAVAGLLLLRLIELFIPIPTYAKLYGTLAQKYEQKNDYPRAIQLYKKALHHNPSYNQTYYELGVLYGKMGDDQQKLAYFQEFVNLGQDPDKVHLVKKDYRRDVDYATAAYQLGLDYTQKGEYLKAINLFEETVKHSDLFTEAYYEMGINYIKLGNIPKAKEQLQHLKKVNNKPVLTRALEERFKTNPRVPFR